MKTSTMQKHYFHILENMSEHDIINGYFGGSNLTTEYLNDYDADATNEFIGDFIDEYWNKGTEFPFTAFELISDPDLLLKETTCEFHNALSLITGNEHAEYILRHAKYCVGTGWNNFYVFAVPWAWDSADWYIIQAENEYEAYCELICRWEDNFKVDDEDIIEGETEINDNNNPVNTDNLQLVGVIKGA